MKLIAVLIVALSLSSAAFAQTGSIAGLFNTGVDDSGTPLPGGSVDPHYSLFASVDPQYGPDAIVHVEPVIGGWMANTPTSKWIGPAANQNEGTYEVGEYIYRLTFNLAGDPGATQITGGWAADNGGTIFINGAATTNTAIFAFFALTPFAISSGFVSGENHLDFHVQNASGTQPNPTGLHVSGISGITVAVIPEPETYALMLAGLGLLGFAARRRGLR
jgi:hypothetical protein